MDSRGLFAFLLLAVITSTIHIKCIYGSTMISEEEDLEIENQLKRLRKPSVKTIKTTTGDIYDCVDIRKQPAFDNPLLKNHKIRMQPSSKLGNGKKQQKIHRKRDIESEYGLTIDCPKETVPIRRLSKEDLIREKLLAKTHASNNHPLTADDPGHHFAIMRSKSGLDEQVTGIEAVMSVHKLDLGKDQYSSTQIHLQRGSNVIQTGILIYPLLNGDSQTRLYAYWKAGDDGCFNVHCNGFVQVSSKVAIDAVLNETLTVGGGEGTIILSLAWDPLKYDWWIMLNDQVYIGYWPYELLPELRGASYYHWGGIVKAPAHEPSPPMGSGRSSAMGGAAYVRRLSLANLDGSWRDPNAKRIETYEDCRKCYVVTYRGYQGPRAGFLFYYGGPGGNCGN